jgi:hypothetical protein
MLYRCGHSLARDSVMIHKSLEQDSTDLPSSQHSYSHLRKLLRHLASRFDLFAGLKPRSAAKQPK